MHEDSQDSPSIGSRLKRRLVDLYESTPIALRSGVYRDTRRLLARHRHASRAEVVQHRDEQVARLIEHAFANVPYYRDVMQERGLRPHDVTSVADLPKLPLLGKDQVMQHHDRLIARNVPERLWTKHNTGGSTGRTLAFWIQTRFTMPREEAFIHDQWTRVGWSPGDRMARVRGDAPPEPGVIARWVPTQKVLAISTYFLTAERAEELLQTLEDYDPHFLHVYPSTIVFLTHLFESRGLRPKLPSLKAILCGSENLYDGQRRLLRDFWGVRPYVWYGLGEGCLLGGGCETSDSYHFFPEYGALELVPNSDAPDLLELVGTTLGNPVMPLIRYRTQDYARYEADHCTACGRPYDLISHIDGRLQEFVVADDGRLLPVTSLIWGQHYACFGRVAKFQLVQDEPGVVHLRVVPRESFRPEDEIELRDRTERATAGGLRVLVERVEDIEPTRAGKHKFVIQNLPLPIGE